MFGLLEGLRVSFSGSLQAPEAGGVRGEIVGRSGRGFGLYGLGL